MNSQNPPQPDSRHSAPDQEPTTRIFVPRYTNQPSPAAPAPLSQDPDHDVAQGWTTSQHTPPQGGGVGGSPPAYTHAPAATPPSAVAPPAGVTLGAPTNIRRPGRRFLPPAAPEQSQPTTVSRDFTKSRKRTETSKLSRNRKIAGDLPAWDPLPPGESPVNRRGSR